MRKDGKLRTTLQDFSVSRIQVETDKDILEIVVNKVTESSSNRKAGRKHKHGCFERKLVERAEGGGK